MYQDKSASTSEDSHILAWQKDVAKSTAVETTYLEVPSAVQEPRPPQITVTQVVSTPAVVVTRVSAPQSKPPDEISTKAIVGTLLGATAGAVVAYAMVKGSDERRPQPETCRNITYRTIEAPKPTQNIQYGTVNQAAQTGSSIAKHSPASRNMLIESTPRTQIVEAVHPRSEHSVRTYQMVSRYQPGIDNYRSPSVQDSRSLHYPNSSASQKPNRPADLARLPSSASATEVRIARDVPLPHSQMSMASIANKVSHKPERVETVVASVHPNDSISQVSSKRSKGTVRSKYYHGSSKSGSEKGHKHESSGASAHGSRSKERSAASRASKPRSFAEKIGFA